MRNFKYKLFLVVLILSSVLLYSQKQKNSVLVDNLYKTTKTTESCKLIINSVIEQYKVKYKNIDEAKWKSIAKDISYTDFITKSKKVYYDNYTESELKEIIRLYNSNDFTNYKKKTKKVDVKLYALGKEFGKDVANQIKKKIGIN